MNIDKLSTKTRWILAFPLVIGVMVAMELICALILICLPWMRYYFHLTLIHALMVGLKAFVLLKTVAWIVPVHKKAALLVMYLLLLIGISVPYLVAGLFGLKHCLDMALSLAAFGWVYGRTE